MAGVFNAQVVDVPGTERRWHVQYKDDQGAYRNCGHHHTTTRTARRCAYDLVRRSQRPVRARGDR